jgi:anti-sigma-K factor RskA
LKHERSTEEIRELAALFALGSLTQHEALSFEAHMQEGCAVCEEEFHKYEHIAAELGFAAGEIAAPDYVRDLLMARIEREAQAVAPAAGSEKAIEPKPQAPPAFRPILSQPAEERSSFIPWILVGICAILAFLIFYAYRSSQSDNAQLQTKLSATQSDFRNLQTLIEVQKGKNDQLEQIFATVSKPDARVLHLAGLAPAPTASGAILWDTQKNQCLIFGYFPPEPQGKAYQLWLLTPTAKIPAGLLKPDPIGRFYTLLSIPKDITNLAFAVTLEPDNGSQIPTLPYFASGRSD